MLDFEYNEKHIGDDLKEYYQNELRILESIYKQEYADLKFTNKMMQRLIAQQGRLIILLSKRD